MQTFLNPFNLNSQRHQGLNRSTLVVLFGAIASPFVNGCIDEPDTALHPSQETSNSERVMYEMPEVGDVEFTAYAIAAFPTLDAEEDSSLVVLAPPHNHIVVDLETSKRAPDLDLALDGAQITATLKDHRGEWALGEGIPLIHGLSFLVNGEELRDLPGGFYDLDIQVNDEPMFYEEAAVYVPLKMDLNLDGVFNDEDLVQAFVAGKYETGESATWEEGDMNGDKLFDSGDLVVSISDYSSDPAPPAPARHVDLKTAKITNATCWLNLWKPSQTLYDQTPTEPTEKFYDTRKLEVKRSCASEYEEWTGYGCGAVPDPAFHDPHIAGHATAQCDYDGVPLEDVDDFQGGTAVIEGSAQINARVKMICAPEFEKLTEETKHLEFPPNSECHTELKINLGGSAQVEAHGNPRDYDLYQKRGGWVETHNIQHETVAFARHTLKMKYPTFTEIESDFQASYTEIEAGEASWSSIPRQTEISATAEARNKGCGDKWLDYAQCDVGINLSGVPQPHLECYLQLSSESIKDLATCSEGAYEATNRVVIGKAEETEDGILQYKRTVEDQSHLAFNPRRGVGLIDFGFLSIQSEYEAKSESVGGGAELIAASRAVINTGALEHKPRIRIDLTMLNTSPKDRTQTKNLCNVEIERTWVPAFELAPQKLGEYNLVQNGPSVELSLDKEAWFVSANPLYNTDDHCENPEIPQESARTWPLHNPPGWLE